jgi:hypothetical protein
MHIKTKVERFRVQRSGLKNARPVPIKGILSSSGIKIGYTQKDWSDLQVLDQCGGQRPPLVTFEL